MLESYKTVRRNFNIGRAASGSGAVVVLRTVAANGIISTHGGIADTSGPISPVNFPVNFRARGGSHRGLLGSDCASVTKIRSRPNQLGGPGDRQRPAKS